MQTSAAGIALIKRNEGCELGAYQDVAGVWTIGYGHTGSDVHKGMTITRQEAEEMLARRLTDEFEPAVTKALRGAPVSQAQFDAMVSLAYNIGVGAFARSSVARLHREGDYQGAADAFRLYNKSKGKILEALVRRREEERALYLSGPQAETALPDKPQPATPFDPEMLAAWVELGQRMCAAAGHDPGPIDGIFGPRTAAAIEAAQRSD